MHIEVKRLIETDKSIIGEMFVDGQHECFCLEPSRKTPVHEGHPCIAAGTYTVELTFSPKFKTMTPELMDVLGRSDIRIHWGNRPEDTLGCTIVGDGRAENWVSVSRVAFERLMTLLKTATDPITATYSDPS